MFKHNIAAVLNTQRPDKSGKYPVRIRVTIKRVVTYYPTGIMVLPEHWDKTAGEIIKMPNRGTWNAMLKKKMYEIETRLLESSLSGEAVTKIPKEQFTGFKEYAEKKIKQMETKESPGTIKHKYSYLKKFIAFRPGIKLKQVTSDLLTDYENYCRKIGNADNTIWSSTKFVISILNAAAKDGILAKDVIRSFNRTRYKSPERNWLTKEEIDQIEKFIAEQPGHSAAKAANWFLLSCYCGLRYGDVKTFSQESIKGGRIVLRTAKAGTDVTIKIHDKLKRCIDRMDFKVTTNEDYNRQLKVIAGIIGLNKPLTSHIARHTFAVQFLEGGGSMEVLSKILGHTTIKTTQIYGKITDKRIDDEIDKVFSR